MKVKYLGIYINSRTNNVDPSTDLRKFFSSFNNIMSVIIIIIIIIIINYYYYRTCSYKTTLQCHDESNSNSSSSHVQLELYHVSGKLREKRSVLSSRLKTGTVVVFWAIKEMNYCSRLHLLKTYCLPLLLHG